MAEKKIPITYRAAVGEEDKKKRICLSPNDSVQQIEEKCKELFKLQGRVCLLKAKIGTDEFIIEANSQDTDVLHDAEELVIQLNNNEKVVLIEGEGYDLEKLPSCASKLVARERLRYNIEIPSMVAELNDVKVFLAAAFYGTRNCLEIHLKVEKVGYMLEKLCHSSLQSLESFQSDCGLMLEKLHGAIIYSFDSQNEMAKSNFKATAGVSKKMIARSSELQKMFEEGVNNVREAIISTTTERSKQENLLEAKMKMMEQSTQESENRAGKDKEAQLKESKRELESLNGRKRRLVQTVEVLHGAIKGLKELSNIVLKTKQIFSSLLIVVDGLASRNDALREKVDLANAKGGFLKDLCQSRGLKEETFSCLSKWVALEQILSSRKIKMKQATDDVHTFLCENPTQEEADLKMKNVLKYLQQKIQLTRPEDDQQEESSSVSEAQQVDPEDNREDLPPCVLSEDAPSDIEGGTRPATLPDVGPEEGSQSTGPQQAAHEVIEREGASPYGRPMTYSNVVKQGVPGEKDIKDTQQGGVGRHWKSTEMMRDEEGYSRGFGKHTTTDPKPKEILPRRQEPFKPCEGANLYIGNLDTTINEEYLERTFRQYGNIRSLTIWKKDGESQGFGFVCYNTPEEAVQAIKHMDGETIKNKSVIVDLAQKKEGRNVYIANLADNIDDQDLRRIFQEFGTITSAKVMMDKYRYGYSKGYGFVCFRTSDQAAAAIEAMNGEIVENRQLYVDLHVPRWKEGRNIYISNLADNIDEDRLYQEFEPFGTITSVKVMVDLKDGFSKGFGFVCFSSPHEARLAIDEMNGKIIEGKQLYVDEAQSRAGRNVYVNNLARHIDDDKLHEAFASFGTITSAKVKTDPKGDSLGFGFVCYRYPQEAEDAISKMNGSTLENMVLYVALAQPPQRREYLS